MTLTPAQQTRAFNSLRAISYTAAPSTRRALLEKIDVVHAEVVALQVTCDHQRAQIVAHERLVADQRATIERLTERLDNESINIMTPTLEDRFLEHFFKLPVELRDKVMLDVIAESQQS